MFLFYLTLLVIATALWGYLFYKKDYHPRPLKVIFQSFVVGLFAMIPVFAYQYLYKHFLPQLAEFRIFQPLLRFSLAEGLIVFALNLCALSLILLLMSGAVSLAIARYPHQILMNTKKAIRQEPFGFVMVSFLIGLMIYFQFAVERLTDIKVVGTVLGTVLFLAIIEEYVKHLMVRISDDNQIKEIDDAITLSIMVGLAFAFVETVMYGAMLGDMSLVIYRSFISIPIHVVASGIFGYYYGLSRFSRPLMHLGNFKKRHYRKWFHRTLNLKRHTIYSEEKIVEGTLLATVYHAFMNLLLEFGLSYLTVPFVVVGVLVIFGYYQKGQLKSHQIWTYLHHTAKRLKPIKATQETT